MNISTDFKDISPNFNSIPGSYEWWYFDGLSEDGRYGFVIILYKDNPFSTNYIRELDDSSLSISEHPAVSISIYKKQKPVYYSFLEFGDNDFSWDETAKVLEAGTTRLKYNFSNGELSFELQIDQQLPSGHSLQGVIHGKGRSSDPTLIDSSNSDRHAWNLLQPVLNFKADLELNGRKGHKKMNFEGKGYHDHNSGAEPMKDSFKDWYWGRYHFKGLTLVYYLMNKLDAQQFEAWLIDDSNQRILTRFDHAELSYYNRNLFGVRSAQKIDLFSDSAEGVIQCHTRLDDGPFYQRFFGDSVVEYNGQVYGAHGISEYILPKNIYKRMYWPLVHMRLRYVHQKPHWVQKSGLLYPWTW